jgi:hypothetical protein
MTSRTEAPSMRSTTETGSRTTEALCIRSTTEARGTRTEAGSSTDMITK